MALYQWIETHGRHFERHPARIAQALLYGLYRHKMLVAVAVRAAECVLRHYTPGGDLKTLWETWRLRG